MSLKTDRKKLLQELVESDTPLKKMQKEYGFNYDTVRKYYPEYRKGRNHKKNNDTLRKIRENEDLIREMAEERAPGSLIAESVGVGKQSLKRRCPDVFWTPKETAEFARMVQQMDRTTGWERKQE